MTMEAVKHYDYITSDVLLSHCCQAIEKSADFLVSNRLPSSWHEKGEGWQELIMDAEHAGIYASCEGLIVLKWASNYRLQELKQTVFVNHLGSLLNDVNEENTKAKKLRNEMTSINYKLAKFLQARNICFPDYNESSISNAISLITSRQDKASGGWGHTDDRSDKPSIAPTIECLIALVPFGSEYTDSIRSGIDYLTENFKQYSKQIFFSDNPQNLTILFWGISELAAWFDEEVKEKAKELFLVLLPKQMFYSDRRIGNSFHVPKLERNDYFRYSERALLATTISNMINSKQLSLDLLSYNFELISPYLVSLINTGYHVNPSDHHLYLWESFDAARAIISLSRVLKGINDTNRRRRPFMWIEPKIFDNGPFIQQDNLCVVLMPFNPDWSDDVFQIIERTVKRIKPKSFEAWRSDKDAPGQIIMKQIWRKINEASLVIADCTGRNPNVFYELGIAHALGKKVLICAQNIDDIPFDIRPIHCVEYSLLEKGKKKLRKAIRDIVSTS